MRANATEQSLADFLGALASASPAPGGGAAAALCGALAAALAAMVGRVAAGRDRSGADATDALVSSADLLVQRLATLVADDMRAYEGVMEARRSKEGPDAMQRALTRATETPLMMAKSSLEVLTLCGRLAPHARPRTASDLGVAAALAWGALEAAALTVRANLAELPDDRFTRTVESELADMLARAQTTREQVSGILARASPRLTSPFTGLP